MRSLEYHGRLPKHEYTVGCWVSRNPHRWTVNVRTPDGGMIVLAEYRTQWGAAMFVRRSWKAARL